MNNLFIKNEHCIEYEKQGYLHIPNFLSSDELDFLKKLYRKKEKSFFDKGFHRTLDMKNLKKKTEICKGISSVVTPISEKYLNEYRMLLTSFMTKEKSADVIKYFSTSSVKEKNSILKKYQVKYLVSKENYSLLQKQGLKLKLLGSIDNFPVYKILDINEQ